MVDNSEVEILLLGSKMTRRLPKARHDRYATGGVLLVGERDLTISGAICVVGKELDRIDTNVSRQTCGVGSMMVR